jgi:hypothetical protein
MSYRPTKLAAVTHLRGWAQSGAGRCETCAAARGPAAELRLAHDHACQLKQLLDSGGGAASQTGSVIISCALAYFMMGFTRLCMFRDRFSMQSKAANMRTVRVTGPRMARLAADNGRAGAKVRAVQGDLGAAAGLPPDAARGLRRAGRRRGPHPVGALKRPCRFSS